MDIERPFIVETRDVGSDKFVRNQMTFLTVESADNWGFNLMCRDFRTEDYRVVDSRNNEVLIGENDGQA